MQISLIEKGIMLRETLFWGIALYFLLFFVLGYSLLVFGIFSLELVL